MEDLLQMNTCKRLVQRPVWRLNDYDEVFLPQLTVIHPDMSKSTEDPDVISDEPVEENVAPPAHARVETHHVEMKPGRMSDMYMPSSFMDGAQKVGATHAVTVIIVVCVGFLLFMIVLGVIRVRAAHHRSQQEDIADTEMAWDDSALNITVNPMEVC